MKTVLICFIFSLFVFDSSIYDIKFTDAEHRTVELSQFKGKKILIVNTACKSPYTFQFEQLQQLYSAYKEKLVVIAFPAGDDFGDQELKTSKQVLDFCRTNYGVSFPISEKTTTIGELQHPVFRHLINEAKEMGVEKPIKWNFTKFLLDENGQLLRVFEADVTPLSTEITSFLNNSRKWSLD